MVIDSSSDNLRTISLQAPCKINLDLHILSKRADGYHELSTRMQKMDLADEITLVLQSQPGITLSCSTPDVPEDSSNLAWKAAEAFFSKIKETEKRGVQISLTKRIPVAAGLGGGSSDAGTVLKGLNILCRAGLTEEQLIAMAKPLGADVPFFVTDHSAVRATGVGERMVAVDPLKSCRIILVNPGLSVSTRWAYENFALTRADKTFNKESSQKYPCGLFRFADLHNDLEMVTAKRYPVIEKIKNELAQSGAKGVLMSGSGPTVFGIFQSVEGTPELDLSATMSMLRKQYGEQVFLTDVFK